MTFAKEPTQTHKGGTSFPPDYLRHSRHSFLRLVHLLLFIGPVCLGLVWWCSLFKHRRHKSQLFHENGTVATKPQERRRCPAASSQGATRRQSFYLLTEDAPQICRWHDGLTGTCFANTMQWASYDPLTEEVSQPDPNLAGYRSHHPPCWPVVPQEREYCAQLARWWTAVQRTRVERQGTAVQVGGGPVVALERRHMQREHVLISQADPGREPRGYFNCTVEVRRFISPVLDLIKLTLGGVSFCTDIQTRSMTFTAST